MFCSLNCQLTFLSLIPEEQVIRVNMARQPRPQKPDENAIFIQNFVNLQRKFNHYYEEIYGSLDLRFKKCDL